MVDGGIAKAKGTSDESAGELESPGALRMSTATAMQLGFLPGRFHRGAKNPCVNVLLTYADGCRANCAYCGLARNRPGEFGEKSFIKVGWPARPVPEILDHVRDRSRGLRRVCISMVTHPKAVGDTLALTRTLTSGCDLPLSILCAPTVLTAEDFEAYRAAGADMIGVALDAATEELFTGYRGAGVRGPHRWKRYWRAIHEAVGIFGERRVSVHLIVGLGETQRELVETFQRVRDAGALIHLFSFFAESGSRLAHLPQPPWSEYLALQVARFLIEEDRAHADGFRFTPEGRIVDFGVSDKAFRDVVELRTPFMTSGCPGRNGDLACNRPFGNCLPGLRQWNYPYMPDDEEMAAVRYALEQRLERTEGFVEGAEGAEPPKTATSRRRC
jgi:biotin synthase-related radical SAM superfamily protein